jgi:hypothetical protein
MKAPDRDCMYCNQLMSYAEIWTPPDVGMGYAGEPYYIYMCEPCKSQQDVDIQTGQIMYYNFKVPNSEYGVCFHPKYNSCDIQDYSDKIHGEEVILSFDFMPDLNPQNTTKERIKLYLVCS